MIRYALRLRAIAMALSMLAGFVDASGFILSRGLFVSFMSGNSTRMGIAASVRSAAAWMFAAVIAAFVLGVIVGSLAASAAGRRRKFAVTGLGAALLGCAALIETLGGSGGATILLALAMGALNNVFLRDGEVSIAVTYVTGTLVRLGQHLAARLRGEHSEWLSYFGLWLGLVVGAIAGGVLAARSADACLWVAAGACLAIALGLARIEAEPDAGQSSAEA